MVEYLVHAVEIRPKQDVQHTTGIVWELLELEYYRQIFDCSVLQIRMDVYTLTQHTDVLIVETVARSKTQVVAVQD